MEAVVLKSIMSTSIKLYLEGKKLSAVYSSAMKTIVERLTMILFLRGSGFTPRWSPLRNKVYAVKKLYKKLIIVQHAGNI